MSESVSASLFTWQDQTGNTNVLDVDVVMDVKDRRAAKLSDHVVEDGSVITDHVVIEPESLTLDLIVTQTPIDGADVSPKSLTINAPVAGKLVSKNYPLDVPPNAFVPGGFLLLSQGLRTVIGAALGAGAGSPQVTGSDWQTGAAGSLTVTTLQTASEIDRVNIVHDQLVTILDSAFLVTVSFKGKIYPNYLLTEVELSHAAGKFGSATFRVSARAFRTVTGKEAKLPDPADFRAIPSQQKGSKPGKTPQPCPCHGMKSMLLAAGDGTAYQNILDLFKVKKAEDCKCTDEDFLSNPGFTPGGV